ncbi:MAG: dodecin family protein [Planctomycetota bacterium]|jgi:flavin-binding protein dodecin
MAVLKVVELVGTSRDGWEDAVQQVYREASDSLRTIHGVRVIHQATRLAAGRVREYLATCRVAYEIGDVGQTSLDQASTTRSRVQAPATDSRCS